MRAAIIIIIIIALFGGGIFLANQGSSSSSSSTSTTQLAPGTTVYDVRTPEEFAAGHAEGAINFPVETILAGTYPDMDKDTPIAVYCHSGNRSGQATAALTAAGFINITDIGAYANLSSYGLSTT